MSSITSYINSGIVFRYNPYARIPEQAVVILTDASTKKSRACLSDPPFAPRFFACDDEGLSDSSSAHDSSLPGDSDQHNSLVQHQHTKHTTSACPPPLFHHIPPADPTLTPMPMSTTHREMGDVKSNYHRVLASRPIRYLSYSQLEEVYPSVAEQSVVFGPGEGNWKRLWVGQVLLEIDADHLAKIFSLLCSVQVHVVPHSSGSFFIDVQSHQYCAARQLNGRVLFDTKGFWFAVNPEEISELRSYNYAVRNTLKAKRLPRSTMVVRR